MPYQKKPGKQGFSGSTTGAQKRPGYPAGRPAQPASQGDKPSRSARPAPKGRPGGSPTSGGAPKYGRNLDRGYEENSFSNQQYGRPGRRGPQNHSGSVSGAQSNRTERPGMPRTSHGSPASQRFGPGSKPVNKPFGRPASQSFIQSRPQGKPVAPAQIEASPSAVFQEEDLPQVNLLTGRNPIREAIKTGRDLEKLMIAKGELSGSAREIVSLAKKVGIMIQSVDRSRLDQLAKNHQGMIAFASAYQYATVDDILQSAKSKNEDPFIVVLDQVTDPHNLGAVIRTAACAGVHGVIVPLHRSVGLTPAAVKASAGAVEHIKVARVTNLSQTIKALQKQGIWFYAAQTEGEDYRGAAFSGPCALVIGSEGEGVSQLVSETCDKHIRIPMEGEMNSLNASVAAAVLMYAVYNQRRPMKLASKL